MCVDADSTRFVCFQAYFDPVCSIRYANVKTCMKHFYNKAIKTCFSKKKYLLTHRIFKYFILASNFLQIHSSLLFTTMLSAPTNLSVSSPADQFSFCSLTFIKIFKLLYFIFERKITETHQEDFASDSLMFILNEKNGINDQVKSCNT